MSTFNIVGNSTSAQRLRILVALEAAGPLGITTIEAREQHDVMAPAARVHELRHVNGKNIATVYTEAVNAQGHKHTNARYVLLPGEWDDSGKH